MTVTTDLCDRLGVAWRRVGQWSGPIWTGDTFIFADDGYGDLGAFHELCHLLVADGWQRSLPDFGLGPNANASFDDTSWRDPRWPRDRQWDATDFVDAGYHDSWSDEDRVTAADAAYQEALACYAMGLYTMFDPDAHDATQKAMNDFSAFPTKAFGMPGQADWTLGASRTIARSVAVPCGLPYDAAVAHLEGLRDAHIAGMIRGNPERWYGTASEWRTYGKRLQETTT